MLKNPKFTIGTVTSEWHSQSTFKTFGIDYKFSINGKEYLYQTKDNSVYLGEKYLVIYDFLNPKSLNRYLTNYLILSNIEPPKNGWKYHEVPITIDSNEIKNYIKNYYKNKVEK